MIFIRLLQLIALLFFLMVQDVVDLFRGKKNDDTDI